MWKLWAYVSIFNIQLGLGRDKIERISFYEPRGKNVNMKKFKGKNVILKKYDFWTDLNNVSNKWAIFVMLDQGNRDSG